MLSEYTQCWLQRADANLSRVFTGNSHLTTTRMGNDYT